MGISGVLDIAKTALMAAQAGIQTTSNNIANVNTPGYTRQRLNQSEGTGVNIGGYYIGTGVTVDNIERVYDSLLGLQIDEANEDLGKYNAMKDALGRLEGIFNDTEGLGLGDVLNDFFSALQDVANDPSDYAARTVLLGNTQTLVDRVNSLDSWLRQEIRTIDSQISATVDDINSITANIAILNQKILQTETGSQEANDLRDQRDSLIKDLSELIDITVLTDDDGEKRILVPGGSLVAGGDTTSLSVTSDPENNNYYDIKLGSVNITDNISSGKLAGLISSRDQYFQDALTRLNTLAASLTKEFNVIHRQGYGLDSSTGLDFFQDLSPGITPKSTNTGGATATVSINTLSSITLDDYEIQFTSSSTFNIVNTTEGTIVSTGNTYTSGSNIDFDGLRVVITDGSSGPSSGDVFKVSVTKDAAQDFALSLSDPNKFAAAQSSSTLPGDNSNVLSMVDLRDSLTLSNGTATFEDFYESLVSDIGIASRDASVNSDAQDAIVNELEQYRESVSGVSLDEEGMNLIKYQYAYQAAAKVLTVVDSLLQTLMQLE